MAKLPEPIVPSHWVAFILKHHIAKTYNSEAFQRYISYEPNRLKARAVIMAYEKALENKEDLTEFIDLDRS